MSILAVFLAAFKFAAIGVLLLIGWALALLPVVVTFFPIGPGG